MSWSLLSSTSYVLESSFDSRFRCALGAPKFTCSPMMARPRNEVNIHIAMNGKRSHLIRWRNTTPRATVRRVIRRGLGCSPGIGVILAIMARMCSSL